jgi:hypothetical protein
MTKTLDALYDGRTLFPMEPLDLQPNTRVRITIETGSVPQAQSVHSFLRTARSLRLEGPPDWSERIEDYLLEKVSPASIARDSAGQKARRDIG